MKKAYINALIAIILWGSFAAVARVMISTVPNMSVVFYACLTAELFMVVLCLFTKKLKELKKLKTKELLLMALGGLLGMFMYNALYYAGMSRLLTQQAMVINYLWPMCIVVFSCLILKEKLSKIKIIALAISFVGVVIVATEGDISQFAKIDMLGVLCCISAAISYGLYSVITMKIDCDKYASMVVYFLSATVVSFIGMILSDGLYIPTLDKLPGLLWIGVLANGVACATWAVALASGDTAKISNLAYTTPFISLIWIYFMLGEPISLSSIIGLVIIVSGVIFQEFEGKFTKANEVS